MTASHSLSRRWTADLASSTAADLHANHVASPFGFVDVGSGDNVDLRGFPIQEQFREIDLERVNFSLAATMKGGTFFRVRATNCIFAHSSWETSLGGAFERCDFRTARLDCDLPSLSRFTDCDFSAANLSRLNGGRITFIRCNFTNARMRRTSLFDSDFDHCIWTGVRFFHSSLARSNITREGFPLERGVEEEGRILPDVILGGVKWT